jgi:tryptophan halogenase
MDQDVNKVVIAGGGTAGWMAAAALSKLVARPLEIILVESESIGTIGVGEATIPSILSINRMLQIPEPDFIKLTSGTFKLGIQFENWRTVGDSYIHSFGDTGQGSWAAGFHHFWLKGRSLGIEYDYGDYCAELLAAQQERFAITSKNRLNYAYHLDAAKYAAYLRNLAETAGVIRVEGRITRIDKTSDGFISSLQINDGEQAVEGTFLLIVVAFKQFLQTMHWALTMTIGQVGCPQIGHGQFKAKSPSIPNHIPGLSHMKRDGAGKSHCSTARVTV